MLVVLLLLSTSMSVNAESLNDVKSKINDLDRKKANLEKKDNSLDSDKANTDKKIDENLNKQSTNKSEMEVIDDKLAQTKTSIVKKENEISKTTEEISTLAEEIMNLRKQIRTLNEEILQLQKSIIEREALLKNRLRSIQESGGEMSYLEVLLGAKSFSDFISRTSAVNTIMDSDKKIMEELDADKRAMEAKKIEVEEKKEQVEANKKEVEVRKATLDKQKKQLNELKSKLDAQLTKKEKIQQKLEKEHGELEEYKVSLEEEQAIVRKQKAAAQKAKEFAESELARIQREKAEAQKRKKQNTTTSSSGVNPQPVKPAPTISTGGFIHPVNGPITSGFGPRSCGGCSSYHYGIDYGVSVGTPVYASAPGIVTDISYDGDGRMNGYGHVLLITHHIKGKTYTTLYAHLSGFNVKVGDAVSQGQYIASSGNTGRSTGPHLHFEIHNGYWASKSGTNPMIYLP